MTGTARGARVIVLKLTNQADPLASPARLTNDLCRRHPAEHCSETRHRFVRAALTASTPAYATPRGAVAFIGVMTCYSAGVRGGWSSQIVIGQHVQVLNARCRDCVARSESGRGGRLAEHTRSAGQSRPLSAARHTSTAQNTPDTIVRSAGIASIAAVAIRHERVILRAEQPAVAIHRRSENRRTDFHYVTSCVIGLDIARESCAML